MDIQVKVVNEKLICCKQNHNEPIVMVAVDQGIHQSEMLLCLSCFQTKRQVQKYISLNEAQGLISEKLYKLTREQEEEKIRILKDLNEFSNQVMKIRSKTIQRIDEILRITQLWITDITNTGRKSNVYSFIEDLQLLQSEEQGNQDQLIKSNQSHYKKIDLIIQKLMTQDDYINCQNILKGILENKIDEQQNKQQPVIEQQNQNINQTKMYSNSNKDNQLNVKKVQLVNTVKQKEVSYAIAFNNSGSIMVTGCGKDIKVWNFEKVKMVEKKLLKGHTDLILCLVFSKKHNWFASCSRDDTIRCWKEDLNKDWVSTQPGESHSLCVYCLILNNKEDQLISGSLDQTIRVWKVNCQANKLEYDYTLEEKHTYWVYCISLNDSETALVSCGRDCKIILWSKAQNSRWLYQHELIMDDYGYRICFISDNQIIWQQSIKGITHLLEFNQGKLIKKPDLNLTLNQENDDDGLFPTIRNKRKQVIIQKYNRYVYILKQQANYQLSIVSEPIDCNTHYNYGSLTEDGEYLIIWNYETKEFKIYNIEYE